MDISRAGLEGMHLPVWVQDGLELSGRALAMSGVELLPIFPEHGYLLRVRAV